MPEEAIIRIKLEGEAAEQQTATGVTPPAATTAGPPPTPPPLAATFSLPVPMHVAIVSSVPLEVLIGLGTSIPVHLTEPIPLPVLLPAAEVAAVAPEAQRIDIPVAEATPGPLAEPVSVVAAEPFPVKGEHSPVQVALEEISAQAIDPAAHILQEQAAGPSAMLPLEFAPPEELEDIHLEFEPESIFPPLAIAAEEAEEAMDELGQATKKNSQQVSAASAIAGNFAQALLGSIRGLGQFAGALVSPHTSPAAYVETLGAATNRFASSVGKIIPGVALFGSVVGEATSGLGKFMSSIDGMVARYGEFSPGVAVGQAMAEITQVMNDVRRAQEATPDLLAYIEARTEMQQKFEDAKLRILQRLMPLALTGMAYAEKLLPLIEGMVAVITNIFKLIPGIGDKIQQIQNGLEEARREPRDFDLPTDAIFAGYVEPGGNAGVLPSGKPRAFVRTPLR